MRLEQLPPAVLDPVEALLGRLKHDLGKYVSLQARWLAPDAAVAERQEALTADLLHTRRGPDGHEGAHEVWAPFRRMLSGHDEVSVGVRVQLLDDPDVARVDAAMNELEAVARSLGTGPLPEPTIDRALARCRDVADACRDLVRRVRDVRGAR